MSTTATRIARADAIRSPMRRALCVAIATAAVLSCSPSALGAGGITPIAPQKGDTIPAGKRSTFKLRVHGKGEVWVHVCGSRAKDVGRS